jgi:hypothetical protein
VFNLVLLWLNPYGSILMAQCLLPKDFNQETIPTNPTKSHQQFHEFIKISANPLPAKEKTKL